MSEQTPTPTPPEGAEGQEQAPQAFTQADVDRIVKERVQRERAKYADYDDLKTKAEGARTAEERIAALEAEVETSKREALRRRVQAAHGIADEDADLFLTGTDEATLTAQAKRLAERTPDRKNHAPREGDNPRPGDDPMRNFARGLFDRAKAD